MSLNNDELIGKAEPLLLSVIGGSPQVITETLFGILKAKQEMPKHMKVITTTFGLKSMDDLGMFEVNGPLSQFAEHFDVKIPSFSLSNRILALLNEQRANNYEKSKTKELKKGEKIGALNRSELNQGDEEDGDVWVIESEGNFLFDARTIKEHTALADFITEKVRLLTTSEVTKTVSVESPTFDDTSNINFESKTSLKEAMVNTNQGNPYFKEVNISGSSKNHQAKITLHKYALHASIAGGRKSMSFFLGELMTIFGRPFDKLSHVEITKELEYKPEFLFPTNKNEEEDVSLAEIPFLLLGSSVPEHLKKSTTSYSFIINAASRLSEKPTISIFLDHYEDKKSKQRGFQYFKVDFNQQSFFMGANDFIFMLSVYGIKSQKLVIDWDTQFPLVMIQSCLLALLGKEPSKTYTVDLDFQLSKLNLDMASIFHCEFTALSKLEEHVDEMRHKLESGSTNELEKSNIKFALKLVKPLVAIFIKLDEEMKNADINFDLIINKIENTYNIENSKLTQLQKENIRKLKTNYDRDLNDYNSMLKNSDNDTELNIATNNLIISVNKIKSAVYSDLKIGFKSSNSYSARKGQILKTLKSVFTHDRADFFMPDRKKTLNIENIYITNRATLGVIALPDDAIIVQANT